MVFNVDIRRIYLGVKQRYSAFFLHILNEYCLKVVSERVHEICNFGTCIIKVILN